MEQAQNVIARILSLGHTSDPPEPGMIERMKAETVNASVGELDKQDGYNCPLCRNKGYTMQATTEDGKWRIVAVECKCHKIRKSLRRMQRSGLKNIIRDYTFARYQTPEPWQQRIKEAAIAYAQNSDGWFFIGGQSGSGKTHICTAICRELLLAEKEVLYMLWRDDIVRLKALVTDAEQYGKAIGRYKEVDVLYIDDLFKAGKGVDAAMQKPTAADINIAFEILNYRYNNSLPTIISSECAIGDLMDIDEALAGRIIERAKAFSLRPDISRNWRLRNTTEL